MAPYSKPKHLAFRTISGKAYIVNPRDSILHELNETGTFIWNMLEKSVSENEIISALSKEFAVSRDEAARDAREFLSELRKKKLLQTADETNS